METRKMKWTVLFSLVLFGIMAAGGVSWGDINYDPITDTYHVTSSYDLYVLQHYLTQLPCPPCCGCGIPPLHDGATIILAQGTYTAYVKNPWSAPIDPPPGMHITYIGSGIGATILDGGLVSEEEQGYFPCVNLDEGDKADVCSLTVICGFTVDCNRVCSEQPLYGFEGASIVCKKDARLVMRHCLVTGGNTPMCDCPYPYGYYTDLWGDTGGIYCEDGNILIDDCTISIANLIPGDLPNIKAPVRVKGGSSEVNIINSNISDNKTRKANGSIRAAISLDDGKSLTVETCTISGNHGAGVMYIPAGDDTGDATITNCTIDGKGNYPGLILYNLGDVTITGCTITDCNASTGFSFSAGAGIMIWSAG